MKKTIFLAGVLALGVQASAAASTVTYHFNDFLAGDVITNISQGGLAATVSATGGIGLAVAFDTDNYTGGDDDLSAPITDLGGMPKDFQEVVIIQENNRRDRAGRLIPDDAAGGGALIFTFSQQIAFVSADILDVEEPGVDIYLDGVELLHDAGESADHRFATAVNPALSPMYGSELKFIFEGSGAIDNLSVSRVPVPMPMLLLLTAFGGLAFLSKRKVVRA